MGCTKWGEIRNIWRLWHVDLAGWGIFAAGRTEYDELHKHWCAEGGAFGGFIAC
jgi:hypothetical protein